MLFYSVKFSFLFQAQYFKIFIMWTSKHSTLNPLFILMYLKDLSQTVNSLIILVSLYTALKATTFKTALMMCLPSWTSGLKQTNFSYTWQNIFATNNISSINLNTCYDLKIIEVVTKFLGLQTDDNLNYNWNNIPKFNQALWWQQSRQQMT